MDEIDDIISSCKTAEDIMASHIAETFTGIPVIIDDNLNGLMYTIHVSRELYFKIKDYK